MDELWLPILVASALSLVISVLAWRVLPHHNSEHLRVPAEQQLLDALRRDMPPPGLYQFPYRGFGGANEQRIDVATNLERGPIGYMVVGVTGPPRIILGLVQHFIFFLIIATLTGYLLTLAGLKDGAPFLSVFRIAATVATMALVLGSVPQSIWFYRPWKSWMLQCVDGIACGATIGAVFALYWPA